MNDYRIVVTHKDGTVMYTAQCLSSRGDWCKIGSYHMSEQAAMAALKAYMIAHRKPAKYWISKSKNGYACQVQVEAFWGGEKWKFMKGYHPDMDAAIKACEADAEEKNRKSEIGYSIDITSADIKEVRT